MEQHTQYIITPKSGKMLEILNSKIDSVLAFISGDLLATAFSIYCLADMTWLHPFLKLFMSFLVGIAGGAGGLFVKTLYSIIEPSIKKKIKSWLKQH